MGLGNIKLQAKHKLRFLVSHLHSRRRHEIVHRFLPSLTNTANWAYHQSHKIMATNMGSRLFTPKATNKIVK